MVSNAKEKKEVVKTGLDNVFLALIGSILIRWCISLGNYSGQNKPPMFGDYEAQRHWQEITVNLPVTEWYTNSSNNNLLYWGLDYPPLTAYHSWLCGYVASKINHEWVALESSRGVESYKHKLFMRYTVLVVDLLVFFPATILLWWKLFRRNSIPTNCLAFFILILYYPGLALIDHGHFQYNNFSLGLMAISLFAFGEKRDILGSIFFCLALNYKQMELYHALPVFFYLLGKAFSKDPFNCFIMIGKLALTVLGCFALLWAPFLQSFDSALQVLSRLFPVGRGLYEDKVANFWCTISPVLKLKLIMKQNRLIQLCGITTLILSLPSCLHLCRSPTIRNFKFSLVNVSLVFFLFSYQVHEKSILIPAVSACFLCGEVPLSMLLCFLHYTVISMSPLLLKDGLTMQLVATTVLFIVLIVQFIDNEEKHKSGFNLVSTKSGGLFWISVLLSYFLVFLPYLFKPPPQYPDLWAVAVSSISCAIFLCFSIFFHFMQFKSLSRSKKVKKS